MLSIFAKKCEYCRTKIENGKEIVRNVKRPGYIGTFPKNFCSGEHANKYEEEAEKTSRNQRKGSGCC